MFILEEACALPGSFSHVEPQSAAGKESAPDMTPDRQILYKQNNNNVEPWGQYKNTLEILNGSF